MPPSKLYREAVQYRMLGLNVIPQKPDKSAYVKWKHYQTHLASMERVKLWWQTFPDANIALIAGEVSGIVVIDADGPDGIERFTSFGVTPGWISESRAGHQHYFFRYPTGRPTLLQTKDRFLPFLDCKAEKGLVTLPPSRHEETGGTYRWLRREPLTILPTKLIEVIEAARQSTTQRRHDPEAPFPEGERNQDLFHLAATLVRQRRLSEAGIRAALEAENQSRTLDKTGTRSAPLPDDELDRILESALTQFQPPERPITVSTAAVGYATLLEVPEHGMIGLAREFADLYSAYMEAPPSFFYFSFLTLFGNLVAKQVTIGTQVHPEPRLYTLLLGTSGRSKKSTAIRMTDRFFQGLEEIYRPHILRGVGSAPGLATELAAHPVTTLLFDEVKSFIDKSKNENSVAVPFVNTLFEDHEYDNALAKVRISVRGAYLSMLAASTPETYSTLIDSAFHDIGFPNRIWLVADHAAKQIAMPDVIPPEEIAALKEKTTRILAQINSQYEANGQQPIVYQLQPEARELWRHWYETKRDDSAFTTRLDTYGFRLMAVLAATMEKVEIDTEILSAIITLLTYQAEVRRQLSPIDAEGPVARAEAMIRSKLPLPDKTGELIWMPQRQLQRKTNYHRMGIGTWWRGLENLKRNGELTEREEVVGKGVVRKAYARVPPDPEPKLKLSPEQQMKEDYRHAQGKNPKRPRRPAAAAAQARQIRVRHND